MTRQRPDHLRPVPSPPCCDSCHKVVVPITFEPFSGSLHCLGGARCIKPLQELESHGTEFFEAVRDLGDGGQR
jgi:hypothetical protein